MFNFVSEVNDAAVVEVVEVVVTTVVLLVVVVDLVVVLGISDSCLGFLGASTRGICWMRLMGLLDLSEVTSG